MTESLLERLATDELEPVGRIATASNATLLSRVGSDGMLAVYKPERGEAPLWDFPDGTLHRREVAAFELDRLLGWDMVPPTVLREHAPHGRGSVQLFVDHDPERHYFVLVARGDKDIRRQLERMVVFDVVANNADRKASHVLVDANEDVWLVDHGVCFHEDYKLRSVAWDFAGEPVPDWLRTEVAAAVPVLEDDRSAPVRRLASLLAPGELDALRRRARGAQQLERFPHPHGPRPVPWPPL